MNLTYLQKISNEAFYITDVGHLKSPTLKEISKLGQNEFGQDNYKGKLNIIFIQSKDLLKSVLVNTTDLECENISDKNLFSVWTLFYDYMPILIESLSFFFINEEYLLYDEKLREINVVNKENTHIGKINNENFLQVLNVIKQLNHIEIDELTDAMPKNKIAADILKRLQNVEKKSNEENTQDVSLANIISAICVSHNSYNFTNIWSLTVNQLYDQFLRQNIKNQIDISALKWGAWGSEPFDFELWYKSLKNKN